MLTPEVVEQVIAGYTRESVSVRWTSTLAKIARYRAKQIAFEEAYTPELTQADVERFSASRNSCAKSTRSGIWSA